MTHIEAIIKRFEKFVHTPNEPTGSNTPRINADPEEVFNFLLSEIALAESKKVEEIVKMVEEKLTTNKHYHCCNEKLKDIINSINK